MSITWIKEAKCWRYEFKRILDGRRYRATRLLPKGWSRAQADAYDAKETAKHYAIASGVDVDEPLIDDAVKLYIDHVIPHQKDGRKAAQTLALLYPDYHGRKLSDLHIVAQEYRLKPSTHKPATIRNRLAYLRAACVYAFNEHNLGKTKPHLKTPSFNNLRNNFPTRLDLLRIMRACRNRESRAITALAFYSGMRWKSEIMVSRFDGEYLRVDDSKNGTAHVVPLHPKAHCYARSLPVKLKPWSIYKYYKEACKKVGLGHLVMHDQRHGTASTLINAGATLSEVGGFLNHTSPQATARYTHLVQSSKKNLMRKLA